MASVRVNQKQLDKFFNKVAQEIAEEARRLAPIGQGDLRREIKVVGNNRIVINPVDVNGRSYAAAVEHGRAPGSAIPPFGAGSRLSIWAGTPGRAVRELARAIARRGIRPKPFFFPAVQAVAAKRFKNLRVR